jgi:transposase-like protein
MSKRRFTADQIIELSKNINVAKCSDKSITYSKGFKLRAIKQYEEDGYSPRMIFEEAGFNLCLIGIDTPKGSLFRWRKTYATKGFVGLNAEARGRSHNGGRPKTKGLTDADRIKRLEIENAYLKAENDFLAKLRAAKKR